MKKYTIKKPIPETKKKFAIDYKGELNPQQLQAVTNIKGPQLVIAGAGTGKTRTLIYRVAYLVESDIAPESILLLTFTRKAAQNMMRRAASMLDQRCKKVSGGTFHSFANFILRKYAAVIHMHPNFSILDRGDAEDVIQLIRTQLELNKKKRRFPRKHTIMDVISKAINKSTSIEKVMEEEYPNFMEEIGDVKKIAQNYQEFKQQKQVMDYDDLLINLKKLLEENERIRKKISNTYYYIMVDEYQDTNRLQAEIALLLASQHGNIMAVGDDSQSIYSFRGANFRNIMDFPKLFPSLVINTLEQNYRSTRPILNLTNAIIENAAEKYSKVLFSNIKDGGKPVYIMAKNDEEQGLFICQRILELNDEGIPLNQMAVLFRAAWHSNELEVELKNKNIPYVKFGGLKFAETAHIKDMLSFLRIIHNIFDEIAWLRVLMLMEGIGPKSAAYITTQVVQAGGDPRALISADFVPKKYYSNLKNLQALLSRLRDSEIAPAEKLEAVLKYYLPLFKIKYDDSQRRMKDFDSLLRISQRYKSLQSLLTDLALEPLESTQVGVEPSDKDKEHLVLSTIHSAKGLEWHTVFIIHLVDGYFPSTFSIEEKELLEEERRLMYVAATRAKKNLFLITPHLESRSWQQFQPSGFVFSKPSRFLAELSQFKDLTESWALDVEEEAPF